MDKGNFSAEQIPFSSKYFFGKDEFFLFWRLIFI